MRAMKVVLIAFLAAGSLTLAAERAKSEQRPRARELGIAPGIFAPGPLNSITDVAGVRVGQVTVIEGEDIRTGVTAIVPHAGNVFREKVPAAIVVANGFGKLIGSTQVNEMGVLETPIILTNTLNVWEAAATLAEYTLGQPGNEKVVSVNPVVGETNDGYLNAIRRRPLRREHFLEALRRASSGAVDEGSVGAGTGTAAFGFKAGIGTASRRLPEAMGGYTVGVLVQSNFGGSLNIAGVPVGKELGIYEGQDVDVNASKKPSGSVMIVVATDAPLDAWGLRRLAARAFPGLARTGADFHAGGGDYVIAFSAAASMRVPYFPGGWPELYPGGEAEMKKALAEETITTTVMRQERLTPLFWAVQEATEEATYNSVLRATTVRSSGHEAQAISIEDVRRILKKYGRGK